MSVNIKKQVKKNMESIIGHSLEGTFVGEVINDASSAAGKMLRPMLLIYCSRFGKDHAVKEDRLLKLAAFVELTHTASLVHDDIIDNAHLRRGKPSIQSKYGKDAAVYAGDYLMSRVQHCEIVEGFYEAAVILSETISHMCIGEIGQAECRYLEDVTCDDYLRNIRGKTASLFKAACMLGAMEAGCDKDVTEKLGCFGEYLGIMFQFRDDLLDFTQTKCEAGKETHKDFHDGIYTIPVLMAMRTPGGKEALLPLMRENKKRLLSCEEIRHMEEIVKVHNGVELTKEEIHRYCKKTEKILESLPEGEPMDEIKRMVHELDKV